MTSVVEKMNTFFELAVSDFAESAADDDRCFGFFGGCFLHDFWDCFGWDHDHDEIYVAYDFG